MNMRNTVQCSGSIITPADGDENDDHPSAGFFITWSIKNTGVCVLLTPVD